MTQWAWRDGEAYSVECIVVATAFVVWILLDPSLLHQVCGVILVPELGRANLNIFARDLNIFGRNKNPQTTINQSKLVRLCQDKHLTGAVVNTHYHQVTKRTDLCSFTLVH